MRRMRGDLRNVPVIIHLSENAQKEPLTIQLSDPEAWNKFLALAAKKNTQEANARTLTWLNEKIKVKRLRVLKTALIDKWKNYVGKLVLDKNYTNSIMPYFTMENYEQAVREILANYTLDLDTNLESQYAAIQTEVIRSFLNIVNALIVQNSSEF